MDDADFEGLDVGEEVEQEQLKQEQAHEKAEKNVSKSTSKPRSNDEDANDATASLEKREISKNKSPPRAITPLSCAGLVQIFAQQLNKIA